MINVAIKISFFILFSLSYVEIASALEASDLDNKIAFLRNGDVWMVDQSGREAKQITKTGGKVGDFLFSSELRYLAYSKVIKYVDDPGLYEEGEAPKVPVYSIVIMDINKQKMVKEIKPPKDEWIHLIKWLPDGRLLYHSADGFSVNDYYGYNSSKNTMNMLDQLEGYKMVKADFHEDGSVMAYSEGGYELHLRDLKSNNDRIVLSKDMLDAYEIKLSYNKDYLTWIRTGGGIDNLWIFNLKNSTLKNIYEGPANPKDGSKNGLSWSFDDNYIGMFFRGEAIIIEINNLALVHKVEGSNFNWISSNKVVFTKNKKIYIYEIDSKKQSSILENAQSPAFLKIGIKAQIRI